MNLGERASGGSADHDIVRVVDGYYETVEDGYRRPTPVLHYHGRTLEGKYRHWSVDDYRPYFYVPASIDNALLEDLDQDRRVLRLVEAERPSIYREPLVRVVTELPWHVKQLREPLHDEGVQTFEADVQFDARFLIDGGLPLDDPDPIHDYCRVPAVDTSQSEGSGRSENASRSCEGETEVSAADVESADPDDDVAPRVCTLDMEVYNEGEFPEPKHAQNRVTAITLYDSYEGDYVTMALVPTTEDGRGGAGDGRLAWLDNGDLVPGSEYAARIEDRLGVEVDVQLFDEEKRLLGAVVQYLLDRRFDVLTGWNMDSFDAPYLVNRCFELDIFAIKELSPTGKVERHDGGGSWINGDITGVHIFDLLAAYKKSQYTELKSNALEDVAAAELDGMEKLDVDEQEAWVRSPTDFLAYVTRDVQATVRINEEKNLL